MLIKTANIFNSSYVPETVLIIHSTNTFLKHMHPNYLKCHYKNIIYYQSAWYSDWLKMKRDYDLKFIQNNLFAHVISLKDRFPTNTPSEEVSLSKIWKINIKDPSTIKILSQTLVLKVPWITLYDFWKSCKVQLNWWLSVLQSHTFTRCNKLWL